MSRWSKGNYTLDELLSMEVSDVDGSHYAIDRKTWLEKLQPHHVEMFERVEALYKAMDKVIGAHQPRPFTLLVLMACAELQLKCEKLMDGNDWAWRMAVETVKTWQEMGMFRSGADVKKLEAVKLK